jgi:cardiolipin synthase
MKIFQKKNIPNLLSVFRILLIPVYIYLFLAFFPDKLYYSAIVFVLAGATDLLDGYLARRNNWVSNIGKLLDPLADKLIEVAALVLLAIRWGQSFVALAIIALLKEVLMIIGAYVIVAKAKVYVMSMWFGKLTTFLLYVEVLVVSFLSGVISSTVCDIMSIVVIVSMLITFVMYYIS